MTNQDNERWHSFKKERPEPGHYQIELVYREGCKPFRLYAYFNGTHWYLSLIHISEPTRR